MTLKVLTFFMVPMALVCATFTCPKEQEDFAETEDGECLRKVLVDTNNIEVRKYDKNCKNNTFCVFLLDN